MPGSIAVVVRAVAFVPGSPLLVPGLGGRADVLAGLRETCLAAVAALGPGPVVILGEGATSAWYHGGTARFDAYRSASDIRVTRHLDLPVGQRPDPLPLALGVGLWLTRAPADPFGLLSVAGDAGDLLERVVEDASLLVVADGSARRGPQAPLPADDRAEPWDDALAAALGQGDLDVDLELGAGLGATTDVWRAAAALTAGRRWQARLLAYTAPLGVAYLVATWLPDPPPTGRS